MDEYTEISATVLRLTDKAAQIERELSGGGTADPEWIPLSQVQEPYMLQVGDCDVISVATWLARDRDWPEAD